MKIITNTRILIILLLISNSCCAFFHSNQQKDDKLKKEIVKGVTTETAVVNLLGMPAAVAPNNIGDEVWNYKNLSYSTKITEDNNTLILWELTSGDSTETSKQYNLSITFNQDDVVKNFELVFSPFESK